MNICRSFLFYIYNYMYLQLGIRASRKAQPVIIITAYNIPCKKRTANASAGDFFKR